MPEYHEYPLITDLDGDEWVLVQDDPAGSPATSRISATNFLKGAHAQIYTAAGAGSQTGLKDTWHKVTQFTTNGLSDKASSDQANDEIVFQFVSRVLAGFNVAFVGEPFVLYEFGLHRNTVLQSQVVDDVKWTNGDRGRASASGIIDLPTASETLELRVKFDVDNPTFQVKKLSLWAIETY